MLLGAHYYIRWPMTGVCQHVARARDPGRLRRLPRFLEVCPVEDRREWSGQDTYYFRQLTHRGLKWCDISHPMAINGNSVCTNGTLADTRTTGGLDRQLLSKSLSGAVSRYLHLYVLFFSFLSVTTLGRVRV